MYNFWEDVFKGIGAIALLLAIFTAAYYLNADKKVDGYYFSRVNQSMGVSSTCVYAHWTNHGDELAFCSANYQEAVDFAQKANQLVKP